MLDFRIEQVYTKEVKPNQQLEVISNVRNHHQAAFTILVSVSERDGDDPSAFGDYRTLQLRDRIAVRYPAYVQLEGG